MNCFDFQARRGLRESWHLKLQNQTAFGARFGRSAEAGLSTRPARQPGAGFLRFVDAQYLDFVERRARSSLSSIPSATITSWRDTPTAALSQPTLVDHRNRRILSEALSQNVVEFALVLLDDDEPLRHFVLSGSETDLRQGPASGPS